MSLYDYTFVVGSDKIQNVFVSQHDRLVDFRLAETGAFFAGREDFDGHVLAAPASSPDLAESTLADHLQKLHLTGDAALNEQRQSRARSARRHVDHVSQRRTDNAMTCCRIQFVIYSFDNSIMVSNRAIIFVCIFVLPIKDILSS